MRGAEEVADEQRRGVEDLFLLAGVQRELIGELDLRGRTGRFGRGTELGHGGANPGVLVMMSASGWGSRTNAAVRCEISIIEPALPRRHRG